MTNIIILTGAGISAESGISTFRDSNGLWENHDVMAVASPEGFKNNPELVHRFYNARRADLLTVEPNAAHVALAKLEEAWQEQDIGGFLIVTQNVDDLHERGGAKNIAHMHGELSVIRCTECRHKERTTEDTTTETKCPDCGSDMRPDVVWFGEMPKGLFQLEKALDATDILISIGTSGVVMPASLFPAVVRQANPDADIIEVNLESTENEAFNEVLLGPATETVPALVERLLAKYATGA